MYAELTTEKLNEALMESAFVLGRDYLKPLGTSEGININLAVNIYMDTIDRPYEEGLKQLRRMTELVNHAKLGWVMADDQADFDRYAKAVPYAVEQKFRVALQEKIPALADFFTNTDNSFQGIDRAIVHVLKSRDKAVADIRDAVDPALGSIGVRVNQALADNTFREYLQKIPEDVKDKAMALMEGPSGHKHQEPPAEPAILERR
jgi:hypothetical protein